MASNLPPGVTASMLPGNRPEDRAAEELSDAVYGFIGETLLTGFKAGNPVTLPLEIDEDFVDRLIDWVGRQYASAFSDGFNEAAGHQQVLENEAMAAGRYCYMRHLDDEWHPCAAGDPGAVLFIAKGDG